MKKAIIIGGAIAVLAVGGYILWKRRQATVVPSGSPVTPAGGSSPSSPIAAQAQVVASSASAPTPAAATSGYSTIDPSIVLAQGAKGNVTSTLVDGLYIVNPDPNKITDQQSNNMRPYKDMPGTSFVKGQVYSIVTGNYIDKKGRIAQIKLTNGKNVWVNTYEYFAF